MSSSFPSLLAPYQLISLDIRLDEVRAVLSVIYLHNFADDCILEQVRNKIGEDFLNIRGWRSNVQSKRCVIRRLWIELTSSFRTINDKAVSRISPYQRSGNLVALVKGVVWVHHSFCVFLALEQRSVFCAKVHRIYLLSKWANHADCILTD